MENAAWIEDSDFTPEPDRPGNVPGKKRSPGPIRLISVLLIEDNRRDADLVAAYLDGVDGVYFDVARATHLAQAKRCLAAGGISLALVDLGLPDSWGLDTFVQLQEIAPHVPMIVLTGTEDEELGVRAVRAGAQDYLVKGMSRGLLLRSIRYALARQRSRRKLTEALRVAQASAANLRSVLASNLDGIVVIDGRGKVALINQAAAALFGGHGEDLVGSAFGFPVLAGSTGEIEVARPDGTRVPVEMRVVQLEWENQPAHLALLRDLTASKQVERDRKKMELARTVQQGILPKSAPSLPGFDIAGLSWTAEATGGDYFDYIPMQDGQWGIVVGDASGHGFGPALLITETYAFTRAFATVQQDLGTVLTLLNRALARVSPEAAFVTMFLARLDPRQASLVYASAGHPHGYIVDAQGAVRAVLKCIDQPLGVSPEVAFGQSATFLLQPGELVVLISDGVLEAADPDGQQFGRTRMLEIVRRQHERPAQEIVHALCRSATEFAREQPYDDRTAVVIKVLK
jgi:serine phosphatase RsbU (regulator of sigma subunit)/FixJ family two-component response regulator